MLRRSDTAAGLRGPHFSARVEAARLPVPAKPASADWRQPALALRGPAVRRSAPALLAVACGALVTLTLAVLSLSGWPVAASPAAGGATDAVSAGDRSAVAAPVLAPTDTAAPADRSADAIRADMLGAIHVRVDALRTAAATAQATTPAAAAPATRPEAAHDSAVEPAVTTPAAPAQDALGYVPGGESGLAAQLASAINAQRVAAGLPALRIDARLVSIASTRSANMVRYDYFDHYGPGGGAFELMRAAGIHFLWAGENLARNNYPTGQAVSVAIQALMASPTHRSNILQTHFTLLGVGLATDANGMLYFTMVFAG